MNEKEDTDSRKNKFLRRNKQDENTSENMGEKEDIDLGKNKFSRRNKKTKITNRVVIFVMKNPTLTRKGWIC